MTTIPLLQQMAKLVIGGQTALITGGSAGIGAALARILYAADVNLIIIGRSQSKLDDFTKSLAGTPSAAKVFSYSLDISNREKVEELIAQTVRECPPVDFLVNNAGFALGSNKPFWEQDPENISNVMGTNVDGLMNITSAVLRQHMLKRSPQPTGTIINVSSITGHMAPTKEAYETSYHTSKAAVEGFTNVLRHETVGTNIRVLNFRPGTVQTEFHARRHGYDEAKEAASYAGIAELQPDDMAASMVWTLLQPERVSVVLMEVLPTSQRSLYVNDREWTKRNPDWQKQVL